MQSVKFAGLALEVVGAFLLAAEAIKLQNLSSLINRLTKVPKRVAMTRILIADDHAVVRSGVRRIIESHAGWTVVAEAADGKEAIDKAIATQPDVAILDDTLPRINGIEATRQFACVLRTSRC